MATKIFVNLPVKDLEASKKFYGKLGYSFNSKFTDETAACLVISEHVYATRSTEVLLALTFDGRAEVDKIADAAEANGGSRARPPEDHGFMYTRPFQDPDGHVWEAFWMDPSKV